MNEPSEYLPYERCPKCDHCFVSEHETKPARHEVLATLRQKLAAHDTTIVELRAALEFYWNRGNHCIQRIGNLYQGPMIDDAGIKARAALTNTEHLAKGAPRHE